MMLNANNIHWEIPEAQDHLFRKHSLDNPEFLIRECRVIKEGHERGVYFHQAGGFYVKRMRTRKARKEWRNWIKLFEKGLPTITPIAIGVARNCAYLVSVAHDDYAPLNTIFDTQGYKERLQVLEGLGEVVRNMHKAGFYHRDLHGGNFIFRSDGRAFDLKMADFQRGCFRKITFSRRLRDLADLALSHFFHVGIKEQLAFLTGYLGSRQEAKTFIRQRGKRLELLILKRASLVADRKVRKSRTVNKYFDRLNLQGGRYRGVYLRKNRDLIPEAFLSLPLDFIYRKEVGVLKDSRSVRVVRYQDVCVKYYKRREPKDLFKSLLGLSKGKKSFRWALAMIYRFIATPEPLCYLEGLGGDSFYLSRFVDGARNLVIYLREVPEEKRKACLQSLAIFLNRMFYRGVYHMDLKGSNILVRDDGSEFEFYLIDTDEIAIFWKGSPALLKKSLLRITRTLVPYFGLQELVGFVNACLPAPSARPLPQSPQDLVDRAFKIQANEQNYDCTQRC
ncbi:MAG: lipopolysaccharide kinase InaA family protein [Pseudomonadota bacterium]